MSDQDLSRRSSLHRVEMVRQALAEGSEQDQGSALIEAVRRELYQRFLVTP